RVFNKRTRRVKENLHVEFLENKAIEKGSGPNWLFDALLEFSSSKPQDHYSTKVPKDSRNPNPTASTSTPPADQMETLTAETPIPTVSSPVPTAHSTDSQEPSSD
nr:ribonuclease H-like domain-containing protein [Tanacetum cinerariifolium]